jgi:uncharacterized protein
MDKNEYISQIVERIKQEQPEKIILFGSYAYGNPDKESDIDLFVIAIDIQQAVEKALKSVYAYNGDKIPRTHSLEILYNYAENFVTLNDISKKDLLIISDYYQSERYPGPKYFMPERNEIEYLCISRKI